MFRKFILVAAAASACLYSDAIAQSGNSADSEPTESEELMFIPGGRPFLEVDYGMTTPQFKGASVDFKTIGLLEFKLGYKDVDFEDKGVISIWESYFFASFANADLGSSGGEGDVDSKFNRFGIGNRFGRGFQRKSIGVDLYNQDAANWTEVSAADYDAADPEAQAIFDRYGSQYRFGQLMEAGMNFRFSPSFAVSAGLEGAIVYPRYVFWPWLGSVAIYSVTQGAVEYFADEIIDPSPRAGRVLYFLLKAGVSLGYYLASRDNMNWPFDSETPLTLESFKLGATYTF
jgi:hypothetical protein